jgi:hypothetical protein
VAYIAHSIDMPLNLIVFRLGESVPVALAGRPGPWRPTTGFAGEVAVAIAVVTRNVEKFAGDWP